MDIDANRAAFVKQAYRYATGTEPLVKARNDAARVIEVNTNLDEATATALASKYLAENDEPLVYEIEFEGVLDLSDFIGGPPRYIPDFPKLDTDGRAMKVFYAAANEQSNTTIVRVRG